MSARLLPRPLQRIFQEIDTALTVRELDRYLSALDAHDFTDAEWEQICERAESRENELSEED
jgi:hypothetical protein